ncbi:MAG: glycosyltransferase [Hyphomicrobiales bacterium]|nr:glycosyltransferase [Hyphomicrobiales bacterium]
MPSENEMFYRLVQKGLDKWNAAFFCGSAALLRRQALEEVGGFHGSSVTEDAETALELHSRGWNSVYVDKPMIAGLQPETFEAFVGQRSRWCRGMVQILLMKNPLFTGHLTLAQRLCYLSSTLFWLFPLSRLVFILAPMAYIFFDLKIYVANSQEFVAYTSAYMLAALMLQSAVFGRVRWPWASDLYEYVLSVMLAPAVIGVVIDPRRPKFNVTAKGQTLDENHLSSLAWPYFGLFGLVVASLVALGFRYANEPESRGLILVVGIWSVLNLLLTGLALGAVSERRERRAVPRVATGLSASLVVGDHTTPVLIEDMSLGGFRARLGGPINLPPRASGILRIESADGASGALETPFINPGARAKSEGRSVGLKFYGLNGDRFVIVAKAMFADIAPIYRRRSSHVMRLGIVAGSLHLMIWAFNQTMRGLYYFAFRRGEAPASPIARSSESSAT